jgi:hypothetical protein
VHALSACRVAAFESLLGDEEARRAQYLAMTYLIAAQSLTIEVLQGAVVRAAIAAIAPAIGGG